MTEPSGPGRGRARPFALGFTTSVIFGVLLWMGAAGAGQSAPSAGRPTVQEVSEGLTCQCGCGLTVANCNHPNCSFSVPVRDEIEGMIGRGVGRDDILSIFRRKYGEKVLSAPTTEGFNILAWTMPFVAIAAGALLVVFVIGRWRAGAVAAAAEHVAEGDFDPAMRQRLERELREGL